MKKNVKRSALVLVLLGSLVAVTGCGAVTTTRAEGTSGGAQESGCPTKIDSEAHQLTEPVGLSPRDKAPASPDVAELTTEEIAKVKDSHFKVGIAMQTMDIDYSTILVRAMERTFDEHGVEVLAITDGAWNVTKQQTDIQNLIQMGPDGILSVPTDSVGMASTYKTVSQAGIKLITLDDMPPGLEWPNEVATSSGMDQKGMGQIAMSILAECIPEGGTVGMVTIDIVLWAANQRDEGAMEWLERERPDITLKTIGVVNPNDVGQKASDFVTANPDLQGLWTPWDGPGLQALAGLRAIGKDIPVTTQDLGTEFGMNIAQGSQLIGGGAQELDAQGRTHALAMIKVLLGNEMPEYIAHPAIAVTKGNLSSAWQQVWGDAPPAALTEACGSTEGCR